ncbi:MAG: hypothetical protein CMG55_05035 [Candidatus Marinimicrobia bacterium]|nr:hypothetical protein [Candidatus Neomarinimicrobiota bacterium]
MKYLWENNKELVNQLQRESKLFHSSIHGFKHWRTVEKNGLYLSQFNGGDPLVISHFAYFHDCMRVNEHRDDGHGLRGGKYALKNKDILELNEHQLDLLYKACTGHTGGRNPSCDTIACCWDADRLDIIRVDAKPDLQWYNTDVARDMVIKNDFTPIDN